MIDYHSSSVEPMQYFVGSPAKVNATKNLVGELWRPVKSIWYTIAQMIGSMVFSAMFTVWLVESYQLFWNIVTRSI
jgi:hypothetical protein